MKNFVKLILILGICNILFAQTIEQDSLALVALYDSTAGNNWTNNTNWLNGPVNTWYGITVYADRVWKIESDNNDLTGSIPRQIGRLTSLGHLRLDDAG